MNSEFDFGGDYSGPVEGDLPAIPESEVGDPFGGTDVDQTLDTAFPEDVTAVGYTEIDNFADSGFTDSKEVGDFIHDNIPPEHVEGINNVEFVNDQSAYEQGLMGMWESDLFTGEASIDVYPHDDRGELYDTIAHEIGHNAEAIIGEQNPELVESWNQLHEQSWSDHTLSGGEENPFVTPYAMESPEEDFAESYAYFVNDPDFLQFVSPDKYDFMATHVFS